MTQSKRLKDLGEAEILQIVQQFSPPKITGDDGAVLDFSANHSLVVTTDVLVDGVHFSDRTTPAQMAGWRAVAANLSDLAAMGATPVGITVGLSLPPDTEIDWLTALYQGMADCLQTYDTPLVGGDLTRSPTKTIAITAFGEVLRNKVIRRDAAQIGDVIVATGFHGDSRAGLELLLQPEIGKDLTEGDRRYLILAHQKPSPRLDVSTCLNGIKTERNFAGMDSSDGLADAVLQICEMSQVGAVIYESQIPISSALSRYQSSEKALEWSLYGGEDFQLVLALPQCHA
ncbi:MAG: thiamine-phosphate kinase, partial [Limnothrix sp.]